MNLKFCQKYWYFLRGGILHKRNEWQKTQFSEYKTYVPYLFCGKPRHANLIRKVDTVFFHMADVTRKLNLHHDLHIFTFVKNRPSKSTFHIIWWLKIEKFFPQYNIYFQQFMFFFSSKKRSCLFFFMALFYHLQCTFKKAQLFSVSILLSRSQTASSNSSAIWSYAKPQSHNRQNLKIISAYYLYLKFV